MKNCFLCILLFCHSLSFAQQFSVLKDTLNENKSTIIYHPKSRDTPENLIVKYYINENDKKALPLKKVNGKYEFSLLTSGSPLAVFITIDFGVLTKFDDNFKKGYCIFLNVKNSVDSTLARTSRLKNLRKSSYYLNTQFPPFEEYGKEIESVKEYINTRDFYHLKLDYLNYKYSIKPEKFKQELLDYMSTLALEKDEDLQDHMCSLYGKVLGDSVERECNKEFTLKIHDSDLNSTSFADSILNLDFPLKKKQVYEKIEEYEKRFPSHPDNLINVYKKYLEQAINNHNLEEIKDLISKVKNDTIGLANSICILTKTDYEQEKKGSENIYESMAKFAFDLIEPIYPNQSLLSSFKYKRIVNCYSIYAYFLSINKKDLEAFNVIQKALKLKPDDKVLLESSADYARKAFGEVFAKKYIDDLIDKYGFSDELLTLLSKVYLNLSLPETELDKLKQKSEPKNLVSKNNEILRNFGTLLAPNVQLMDIDNNLVDLHNLKGKRVFIYFWAMWCGPCRAAMPTLMELKEKYKDVNFILIDTWEKDKKVQDEIKAFLVKNKYTFKVLLDSKYHAADLFKIEALPTKFLIDQNGNFELLNPSLNELDTYLGRKH